MAFSGREKNSIKKNPAAYPGGFVLGSEWYRIRKDKETLEKFYKVTVGRGLKMKELKEKIREMEEKMKGEGNRNNKNNNKRKFRKHMNQIERVKEYYYEQCNKSHQ